MVGVVFADISTSCVKFGFTRIKLDGVQLANINMVGVGNLAMFVSGVIYWPHFLSANEEA